MKKWGLFAFLGLFLISLVSAYECPMGGYSGMMSGGYGNGMMVFGWIISLLTITLLIAAIYWLIKSANRKGSKRFR